MNGSGFSTLPVIDLFAGNGSTVESFGGLNGGSAKIPPSSVTAKRFTFTRPAGAVAGDAFVEAIQPPIIPSASSSNDREGAFTLS